MAASNADDRRVAAAQHLIDVIDDLRAHGETEHWVLAHVSSMLYDYELALPVVEAAQACEDALGFAAGFAPPPFLRLREALAVYRAAKEAR